MNSRFLTLTIPAAFLLLSPLLVSCASDDDPGNYKLEQKIDRRTANYQNRMDRRSMRNQARDQRYDAWFDMVMQ